MSGNGYDPPDLSATPGYNCANLRFPVVPVYADRAAVATITAGDVADVILAGVAPTQSIQCCGARTGSCSAPSWTTGHSCARAYWKALRTRRQVPPRGRSGASRDQRLTHVSFDAVPVTVAGGTYHETSRLPALARLAGSGGAVCRSDPHRSRQPGHAADRTGRCHRRRSRRGRPSRPLHTRTDTAWATR